MGHRPIDPRLQDRGLLGCGTVSVTIESGPRVMKLSLNTHNREVVS